MSVAQTIALIDNLPSDATEYYLWIATWPETAIVRASYRASPRAAAIHSTAVYNVYTGKSAIHTLTPLLLLNAIPVVEDLLTLIAARPQSPDNLCKFMTSFWELCASLPRPSRLLYDPTIREPFRTWINETAIPWWNSDRQTCQFATLWNDIILPTWEAVRAVPHPAIPTAVAAELTAAAWAPERVVGWCLPHDEAAALRERWTGTATATATATPKPDSPPTPAPTPPDTT